MAKRPAKTVLLIENQPEEARLIREMLNDPNSGVFELAHVESMSDAEKYLAGQSVDIVLLDIGLTRSNRVGGGQEGPRSRGPRLDRACCPVLMTNRLQFRRFKRARKTT